MIADRMFWKGNHMAAVESLAAKRSIDSGGTKKLLIDGNWVSPSSGETFETRNPANNNLLGRIASGNARDIELAVGAARRAFEGPWSKFSPFERQRILLKFADLVEANFEDLCVLDTLDMGVPISLARSRKQRALGLIRFYAGLATTIHGDTIQNSIPGEFFTYTLKEPVGVVGAITPWNAPLTSTIWKLGPVLATGCTMVLKPAEQASLTPLRLGELLLEAGLPDGVVNIVTGYGETAGAALAGHMGVDKVAFTGSHFTGQKIIEAAKGNIKRVTLELGGKSPDIVFADADLDAAVPGAAMAVFMNSGQICSAGTRLLVERSIYDEFVGKVADYARTLRVGDGLDPDTQIGPLVSAEQLARVKGYLAIGRDEGAQALVGGDQLSGGVHADGFFVAPTVLAGVRNDMRVAQEEIFGPVLSAIAFDDFDEAARIANATSFGLGSGVWTRDVGKAHRMAKTIRAGTVWVNCYAAMDPAVPFGGYKMSGHGRESGTQHIDAYLETKSVIMKVA
jgi:aldehyde dehydrogenase (NAD+)